MGNVRAQYILDDDELERDCPSRLLITTPSSSTQKQLSEPATEHQQQVSVGLGSIPDVSRGNEGAAGYHSHRSSNDAACTSCSAAEEALPQWNTCLWSPQR